MLDIIELRKYFTKSQQQDMIDLDINCMQTPPGRIRRARVRKIKPNHIPRPVNSFMSYRTEKQSIIRQFCPTANHRDISKMVAKWWHSVGSNEKEIFVEKAKAAKDAHSELYPDYIFRPKAKRTKNNSNKNTDLANHTQDNPHVSTSARTRPFIKPTSIVKSHFIQPNTKETNIPSRIDNSINFNTLYENSILFSNSNVYNDGVIFQTKEDMGTLDFWDTYQLNEQVMPSSFPELNQVNDSNFRLGYFHNSTLGQDTSPIGNVSVNGIDPLITILPNTNISLDYDSSIIPFQSNTSSANYLENDGQLFSSFDYEVTPQSQTLSTPRLGYLTSPLSPQIDISTFFEQDLEYQSQLENQTFHFENNPFLASSLPTDLLSPLFGINDELLSSWSNSDSIKYENPSLLGDCDFWGDSII